VWARRWRDIVAAVISDLGGNDILSEGQKQITRRIATLCIACEQLECKAAEGEQIDLVLYGTLTDRLSRAWTRLGLKRISKPVPSLMEFIAQQDRERQREADRRSPSDPEEQP
jgi:hypothetical protein